MSFLWSAFAAALSTRTPLNFFAAVFFLPGRFRAMNSPEFLSRFVQALAPPKLLFVCDRFFTAPLRALSPAGLLTAIFPSAADFLGNNAENLTKFPARSVGLPVEIRETAAGVQAA
jgi:hypothetical protein